MRDRVHVRAHGAHRARMDRRRVTLMVRRACLPSLLRIAAASAPAIFVVDDARPGGAYRGRANHVVLCVP
eukprot:364702-Chlamydomonas_euryale.AAC.4